MSDSGRRPYHVDRTGDFYAVLDARGEIVCTLGDRLNAEQYAALLNQAFERGYRAGYHAAKHPEDGTD